MRILCTINLLLLSLVLCAQQTVLNSFDFEGRTREFAIYIPVALDSNAAAPLILVLHHNGATGPGIIDYMGFDKVADTAGFLSVYPTALEDQFVSQHAWSAGINPLNQINDVGFLSALIDSMAFWFLIDTTRIYATGHSMGGFMSHRLGCDLANRLAAIAPSAGTLPQLVHDRCSPSKPMPVMHKHGTNDGVVLWDGSEPPLITSVDTTIAFWVKENNCPSQPVITELPDLVNDGIVFETHYYGPCDNGTEVILYKGIGAPHGWQAFGHDIVTPVEVWSFFQKFDINGKVQLEDTTIQTTIHSIEDSPLRIFPNPVQNKVLFSIPDNGVLSVYDLFGLPVLQERTSKRSFLEVDLSEISSGWYLVELQTTESSFRSKLLKQ